MSVSEYKTYPKRKKKNTPTLFYLVLINSCCTGVQRQIFAIYIMSSSIWLGLTCMLREQMIRVMIILEPQWKPALTPEIQYVIIPYCTTVITVCRRQCIVQQFVSLPHTLVHSHSHHPHVTNWLYHHNSIHKPRKDPFRRGNVAKFRYKDPEYWAVLRMHWLHILEGKILHI
jgi:hypothetical protein